MSRLRPRPTPDTNDVATRAGSVIERVDPIRELPLLILYPHSRCNCRCVMCDIWQSSAKDEIGVADVAGWLSEWRALGLERVVLSGGEPLMHSDLWALLDPIREVGIGITILSTGILLQRHARQIAAYCDDVVVSLDGPRSVHNAIRNLPRAYEKLAEGVAALKAVAPSIHVSARCTVQRRNFRHLRATVEAARDLGVDRVSFLAADVSSEAFNRSGGWDPTRVSNVALSRAELPALDAELDALERECAEEFARGFVAESPGKLRRRLRQYYGAVAGDDTFPAVTCNAPWVSTVVEADGTVRPCYFQPSLGNLRDAESLGAILNSVEAIAWRRGLDTGRNDICRRCVCSLALRRTPDALDASAIT